MVREVSSQSESDSDAKITASLEIPASWRGARLDKAAADLLPRYSRTQLAFWIRQGSLTLDGETVRPRHSLRGGEKLRLNTVLAPLENWQTPQQVPFRVVLEDESFLVVDKPAGVVVHPGAGNPDRTLVNGLLAYRNELARLPRAGLIHRLDKNTSGLLIVAATLTSLNTLTRALAAHDIERRYVALTEGVLTGGRNIEAPIGRDVRQRKRQRVSESGRYALTRVRLLHRYRAHSLIEARLMTGRTHQIRVHLSSIGYPLLGDRLYGAKGRLPELATDDLRQQIGAFRRQALHARKLAFAHPVTGQLVRCEAGIPEDLVNLMRVLEADQVSA